MAFFDIVILTEEKYLNPAQPNTYTQNVLQEDRLVQQALEKQGLKVGRQNWADTKFDWSSTRFALFRTTWNYFHHMDAFSQWMNHAISQTTFINAGKLVWWNIDKHYLQDLGDAGINIIPTRYIKRGAGLSLRNLTRIAGWEHAVIKPVIGGGGRHTFRINPGNVDDVAAKLETIMQQEDFMIQPFQNAVPVSGEWSYIFFGEQYSHAVLKKAKPGDFRVQDDFGGTVQLHPAQPSEIEFARSVVQACPQIPDYARVDVVLDNEGKPAVSEVELIEPELWFRLNKKAASDFAAFITKKYFR